MALTTPAPADTGAGAAGSWPRKETVRCGTLGGSLRGLRTEQYTESRMAAAGRGNQPGSSG